MKRLTLILAAALCAAPLAAATAQQSPDSAQVRIAATSASGSPVGTTLPGPRVSLAYQQVAPTPAPSRLSEHATFQEGGRHTYTISTLALVLGVIIIVLLIR